MKWKGFTPEEIVLLRNNPYTLKVTERTIRFTLPFKQYMLEGLQHGKSPATIVQELGYDPTIFGQSRLSGIAYHIIEDANSPIGLHEGRRTPRPVKAVTEGELASIAPSYILRRLQAEVSYLRQEVEFLKKIVQAENGKKRGK